MFNEPFGIGDAVTPAKVADEAADPDVLSVPFAVETLAAVPLGEGDELEVTTWLAAASIDIDVSVRLLLGGIDDAVVPAASSRGRMA